MSGLLNCVGRDASSRGFSDRTRKVLCNGGGLARHARCAAWTNFWQSYCVVHTPGAQPRGAPPSLTCLNHCHRQDLSHRPERSQNPISIVDLRNIVPISPATTYAPSFVSSFVVSRKPSATMEPPPIPEQAVEDGHREEPAPTSGVSRSGSFSQRSDDSQTAAEYAPTN